jgi:hypothetical protein
MDIVRRSVTTIFYIIYYLIYFSLFPLLFVLKTLFRQQHFLVLIKKNLKFKNTLYRLYFFNLLKTQTVFCNFLSYTLFLIFNSSNFILTKNKFFFFLHNKRMSFSIKHSYFYKSTLTFNNTISTESMFLNFLIGFKSLWLMLRNWVFSVFLATTTLVYLSFLKLTVFNIFALKLIILFGIFYWLFSGFTFFLKKYRYRYFTSSLQRFWKRCYAIFWMLEFFLFFIYFYLTFMASQEPFLMYDNAQIFKTHLFSWKLFLLKIFPSTLLIMLTYFFILATKWTATSKLDFFLLIITFLLFFLFWLEFYQFFHIISYYGNYVWKLSDDLNYWYLEGEIKRTRINNHFISICLIAKFWHIVFTLVFWLFFVLRGLETSRVRFPLLVANFQNFIFIYILTWLYMFPWVKYTFLKLFNTPYYWFFVNNKRQIFYILFNDFYFISSQVLLDILYFPLLVISSVFDTSKNFYSDFFNFHNSSYNSSFSQYKKNYIRDCFIKNLTK